MNTPMHFFNARGDLGVGEQTFRKVGRSDLLLHLPQTSTRFTGNFFSPLFLEGMEGRRGKARFQGPFLVYGRPRPTASPCPNPSFSTIPPFEGRRRTTPKGQTVLPVVHKNRCLRWLPRRHPECRRPQACPMLAQFRHSRIPAIAKRVVPI